MRQCHGTAALLLASGTRGQRFSLPQGRIGLVPFEVKAGMEDDLTHGREFNAGGAIAYGLIDSVVEC